MWFTDNSCQAGIPGSQSNNVNDSCDKEIFLTPTSIELVDTNPHNLEVGSVIQYGEPVQCGVIKWIGYLPNEIGMFAGIEMVRDKEIFTPVSIMWNT